MTAPPPADRPGEQEANEAAKWTLARTASIPARIAADHAAAVVAAAYPIIAAALADKIEEHAGPLTDARVCMGVGTWEPLMGAGYTAAIGEVVDILRSAAARSGVSE